MLTTRAFQWIKCSAPVRNRTIISVGIAAMFLSVAIPRLSHQAITVREIERQFSEAKRILSRPGSLSTNETRRLLERLKEIDPSEAPHEVQYALSHFIEQVERSVESGADLKQSPEAFKAMMELLGQFDRNRGSPH